MKQKNKTWKKLVARVATGMAIMQSSLMVMATPVNELLVPTHIYILEGEETKTNAYNIYARNIVLNNDWNPEINIESNYGKNFLGRWQFKSIDPEYIIPNESFEMTFRLTDFQNGVQAEEKVDVEIVDKSNTQPVRLLAIGDSLTRAGIYIKEVEELLPDVTPVGTRTYVEEDYPREGRGGWTLGDYFTRINNEKLDSPFVFPVGVSGAQYKGNTLDWQQICYISPDNHEYKGFQKLARGWKDEGEYLYDEEGYYKYPEIGDVMCNPTLQPGTHWVEWDGTAWVTMENQQVEFEVDFSKYMERFAYAFPDGLPTHISLLMGANDFGSFDTFEGEELFLKRYEELIISIHEYDPEIKVIVCTTTVGPHPNILSYYAKGDRNYDRNTRLATHYILDTFDTEENRARNVYVAPMHMTLDSYTGFDYIEADRLVEGIVQKVTVTKNGIHPNNEVGQKQMGNTLAAVIQKYR